jgi:hypothetical protein
LSNKDVRIEWVDEYYSYPLAISLSAFEQISTIEATNRVYQVCAGLYTATNPMVAQYLFRLLYTVGEAMCKVLSKEPEF